MEVGLIDKQNIFELVSIGFGKSLVQEDLQFLYIFFLQKLKKEE